MQTDAFFRECSLALACPLQQLIKDRQSKTLAISLDDVEQV